MKNILKKLLILALFISSTGLTARVGHGGHGGHRGGHHHSGGHHSGRHHSGHHGGHHYGRRTGDRHGGHSYGHRGYARHGYYGGGWRGWGWGYGGWLWGATAALIGGAWLFGGYSYPQWRVMAQEDPEKQRYFDTVVNPAYRKYQRNPNSVPAYDAEGDTVMTDTHAPDTVMTDANAMEIETNIDTDYIVVRRCCTDASSNWYSAGPDRAWREENITPESFTIYRRSENRPISFTDLAEQPQISGFEQSVYTSPK